MGARPATLNPLKSEVNEPNVKFFRAQYRPSPFIKTVGERSSVSPCVLSRERSRTEHLFMLHGQRLDRVEEQR
jgi:hypothetical protein